MTKKLFFKENVMSKNILLISFQVAIIFACAGLVRNTVYSYLPLYLIERLQFAKVNIVSVFAILFNLKRNAGRSSATTNNNNRFCYMNFRNTCFSIYISLFSLFPFVLFSSLCSLYHQC